MEVEVVSAAPRASSNKTSHNKFCRLFGKMKISAAFLTVAVLAFLNAGKLQLSVYLISVAAHASRTGPRVIVDYSLRRGLIVSLHSEKNILCLCPCSAHSSVLLLTNFYYQIVCTYSIVGWCCFIGM